MSLIKSWLDSANAADGLFPLNNLPFGVFSNGGPARCCTAVGDRVLDLAALEAAGLMPAMGFDEPALNTFMAKGNEAWSAARDTLIALLSDGSKHQEAVTVALHPMAAVTLHLPFRVAEFIDFYSGKHHATNVGVMFRGFENALSPNWLHMPIAYNGRASTVVVSGTNVARPVGQTRHPSVRARGWISNWKWAPSSACRPTWGADHRRTGRRHDLRLRPLERLVGARHPGLGVPAARPVPVQGLRHVDQPVGGHQGGA